MLILAPPPRSHLLWQLSALVVRPFFCKLTDLHITYPIYSTISSLQLISFTVRTPQPWILLLSTCNFFILVYEVMQRKRLIIQTQREKCFVHSKIFRHLHLYIVCQLRRYITHQHVSYFCSRSSSISAWTVISNAPFFGTGFFYSQNFLCIIPSSNTVFLRYSSVP